VNYLKAIHTAQTNANQLQQTSWQLDFECYEK